MKHSSFTDLENRDAVVPNLQCIIKEQRIKVLICRWLRVENKEFSQPSPALTKMSGHKVSVRNIQIYLMCCDLCDVLSYFIKKDNPDHFHLDSKNGFNKLRPLKPWLSLECIFSRTTEIASWWGDDKPHWCNEENQHYQWLESKSEKSMWLWFSTLAQGRSPVCLKCICNTQQFV